MRGSCADPGGKRGALSLGNRASGMSLWQDRGADRAGAPDFSLGGSRSTPHPHRVKRKPKMARGLSDGGLKKFRTVRPILCLFQDQAWVSLGGGTVNLGTESFRL